MVMTKKEKMMYSAEQEADGELMMNAANQLQCIQREKMLATSAPKPAPAWSQLQILALQSCQAYLKVVELKIISRLFI